MTATPILLADAITAVINTAAEAEPFDVAFTARRSYPDWDLEYKDLDEIAGTQVDVVYSSGQSSDGANTDLDSYQSLETVSPIDVCVRHRFGSKDRDPKTGRLLNASIDVLATLVEEINELLASERFQKMEISDGLFANWQSTTIRAYVNQWRLREGVYEGVVRTVYSVSKVNL